MPVETNSSSQSAPAHQSGQYGAVGNPGGSIQDAMNASRSRLNDAYATVQQRSNEILEDAEGYIQRRPMQAVIYAASIGAVIGLVAGLMLGERNTGGGWQNWHKRWW